MKIGIPKEIKNHEYRVGMVPASVLELTKRGHQVFVETQAGAGIGFSDDHYREVGAEIRETAQEIFDIANLIVKVKEPQPEECRMLKPDQVLFTYLHLAPDPEQTNVLKKSGAMAIAYETVTDAYGRLPLLAPMSEVAGRMSIQAAAHCLEKAQGGSGTLLGGVPGVARGHVLVLGGGVVGTNALRMAMGLEAKVTVIEKNENRLRELDLIFGSKLSTVYATQNMIEHYLAKADVVIGAALVAGAQAPKLVTKEMLALMQPGSVLVDVSIDQGGCFATSKPTTHANPTYIFDDIVHYCVSNMPGAVPRTATFALNNVTLPYVINMAEQGVKNALLSDPHLMNGLNVVKGEITHAAVAEALQQKWVSPVELL